MTVSLRRMTSLFIGCMTCALILADPISRGVSLAQVLGILSSAVVVGSVPLARGGGGGRLRTTGRIRRPGAAVLIALALLGSLSLSTGVGLIRHTVDSLQGLRDLRDLAIFVLVLTGFSSRRWTQGTRLAWLGAIVAGGSLAMTVEVATRGSTWYEALFNPPYQGMRYVAGFLGPNEYGAMASIVTAIALGLLVDPGARKLRVLAIVGAVVGSYVLVSTLSRGSLVGLVVAVSAIYTFWLIDRRTKALRTLPTVVGRLVVVMLILAVVAAAAKGNSLESLVGVRLESNRIAESVKDRLILLEAAHSLWLEHPIMGTGLGGYAQGNERYGGTGTLSPHSEIAKVLAEGGLIGVTLLLGLFVIVLLRAIRGRKQVGGYAALGGIVAFLVAEQFFSYLVRPGVSLEFAVLAATMEVGTRKHLHEHTCSSERLGETRRGHSSESSPRTGKS